MIMLVQPLGGPVPAAWGLFKHAQSAAPSWNTPDKIWSEEGKEEEVSDMWRESYSFPYIFLPCWNE